MKIAKAFAAALLTALMIYLFGAFVAADFNIANWSTDGRVVIGFFGLVAAGAAALSTLDGVFQP